MRRFDRYGWLHAMAVVGAWRAAAELLERRRLLAASGLLAPRVAERRTRRVRRALDRLGLEPRREGVHAAVRVGEVDDPDVDDVALLEGAMRRASRAPSVSTQPRAAQPARKPVTDWGDLLQVARVPARPHAHDSAARSPGVGARVPAWATVLAGVGVALTFAALVRPLEPAAPWLAAGGVALALAGWLASRRR